MDTDHTVLTSLQLHDTQESARLKVSTRFFFKNHFVDSASSATNVMSMFVSFQHPSNRIITLVDLSYPAV